MSRNQWNRSARYGRYEEYYPPYADPYDYDEEEMEPDYYYDHRRRYLPDGCANLLLVVVVVLAVVMLILLTVHPQGFQLINF
jgi:hypothetical protein